MGRITGHRTTLNVARGEPQLSPRILAPTEFDYCFEEGDDLRFPALIEMSCAWNFHEKRYEPTRFTLVQREGGAAISSAMLRKVPVGEIVELATNHFVMHLGRVQSPVAFGDFRAVMAEFEHARQALEANKMTDQKLEWVALLYEMSRALGNPPVQEIADSFGVSLRSASNWVRQARERGVLEVSDG